MKKEAHDVIIQSAPRVPDLVRCVVDAMARIMVEKTYVEGGYVSRARIDQALRHLPLPMDRSAFIELLIQQWVLMVSGQDYYPNPLRAQTMVRQMRRGDSLCGLGRRGRTHEIHRLCNEAAVRRRVAITDVPFGFSFGDRGFFIAFCALARMAMVHEGGYRVSVPRDLSEISDAWLDEALVKTEDRADCVLGIEALLGRQSLFRFIGPHRGGDRPQSIYAFQVSPHLASVHVLCASSWASPVLASHPRHQGASVPFAS